jgi:twitching motility two-component system response regulator PilG
VEVPLAPVAAATHETHDSGHAHTNGNGHQEGRRIILVVDDSPTIQKVVSVTLEAHGHEVVTASDGMEALSKLRTLKPDLVLLDITMPHMDGYQLCRIMRSNDITRNVPIVMLSGKDGLFDKMRGRMAGAASYITKPFAPSTLPPLIDKYCKRAS